MTAPEPDVRTLEDRLASAGQSVIGSVEPAPMPSMDDLVGECQKLAESAGAILVTGANSLFRSQAIVEIVDQRSEGGSSRSVLVLSSGDVSTLAAAGFVRPSRPSPGQKLVGDVEAYHSALVQGITTRFWDSLDLVVVAGFGEFVGASGCHAAMLIRRVRRLCQIHAEKSPAFLVLGSPLSNGAEHATRLLGVPVDDEITLPSCGGGVLLVAPGEATGGDSAELNEHLAAEWPTRRCDWTACLENSADAPRAWSISDPDTLAWVSANPSYVHDHLSGFVDPVSHPAWFDHVLAAAAEHPITTDDGDILGGDPFGALAPFEGRLVDAVDVPIGPEPVIEEPEDPEADEFLDPPVQPSIPGLRYRGWEPVQTLVDVDLIDRRTHAVVTVGRGDPVGVELESGQLATIAHPGAVLLAGGNGFRVQEVDLEEREIRVVPESEKAIEFGRSTRANIRRHQHVLGGALHARECGSAATLSVGALRVSETVESYVFTPTGGRASRHEELDVPFVVTYDTVGTWLDFEPSVGRDLESAGVDLEAAVNGLQVALSSWIAWEMGGRVVVSAYASHALLAGGGIFFHEATDGGAGRSQAVFDRLAEYLDRIIKGLPRDIPPRIGGEGLPPADLDPVAREAVTGRRCDARATVMLAELIRGSSAREAMESAGLSQQKEDPVPVVVPVEIDMVTPRGAWALRARDKVTHDQWGPGVVVRVEEADGEDRARVRFSDGTERNILAEYLKKSE